MHSRSTFVVVAVLAVGIVGARSAAFRDQPSTHFASDSADLAVAIALAARLDSLDRQHELRWRYFTDDDDGRGLRPAMAPVATQPGRTVVGVARLADTASPAVHWQSDYYLSSDGSAEYRHYFDSAGRALAFDRLGSWFGAGCRDLMRDHLRVYYSPSGRALRTIREFMDAKMVRVDTAGCSFRYPFDSVAARTYAELVRRKVAPPDR